MTVTKDDFNKIWASTSSVPTYTFSDTDYQNGWEFVGNLPPTRAMWDEIQRKNDEKMQLLYNGASFWVDSVADLRTANASIGEVYATKGYYTANDGGNGFYVIRADNSDTDDGGSIIILDNGNVAELITNGTVTPEQFGAKGDGATDDLTAIKNAIAFANTIVFAQKTYIVKPTSAYNGITIQKKCTLHGNGATIKLDVSGSNYCTVIRAINATLTLCNLILDGNSYLSTTVESVCLYINDSSVYSIDCEYNNCSYHSVDVHGSATKAYFVNTKIINCAGRNNHSHVYASSDPQTTWVNVYHEQSTFDLDNSGQGFYLNNGIHMVENYSTKNIWMPFDVRDGKFIINNGYFYNSVGLTCQTTSGTARPDIIATNLIYDQVASVWATSRAIMDIFSVNSLVFKNVKFILSATLQALNPGNMYYYVRINTNGSADRYIGKITLEDIEIVGEGISSAYFYVRGADASSDIKLINMTIPKPVNWNSTYLVVVYDHTTAHLHFENIKMEVANIYQVICMDASSNVTYTNYTYIGDFPQRGTTAERPILAPVSTALYYDTDLSKLMCWNGTSWVEVTTV